MKYNGKIYSCQVPEKLKTHEYMRFSYIYPLENYFTKTLFCEFCGTNNYSNINFLKYITAYEQIICQILCVVPILYKFSKVLTSIHILKKCQYQPNLGPVYKD